MIEDLEILKKIIAFADHAHDGQMRKNSHERYMHIL